MSTFKEFSIDELETETGLFGYLNNNKIDQLIKIDLMTSQMIEFLQRL